MKHPGLTYKRRKIAGGERGRASEGELKRERERYESVSKVMGFIYAGGTTVGARGSK